MKSIFLIFFLAFVLSNAQDTDFFEVSASSTATGKLPYHAIDSNDNTSWKPSASFTGPQNISVSFSSPQVLGNLTWVISAFTDYEIILYGFDNLEVGRYACNGTCSSSGETVILPSPYEVSRVMVDLTGINQLQASNPSLYSQEVGRFEVASLFAHAICSVGSPFDLGSCNDTCGIIPDPYRYDNVPVLDMEKLKLETNGVLTISFDMEGVRSRVINIMDISGDQSCSNAELVPWQQVTSNNTCAVEMNVKYFWSKLWTSCPLNLKFFETNDSASAWFLVEIGFLENITVNNGLKRNVVSRGVVTRDFLAEYSIGIYTNRFVTLESVINITICLGVVCPAADQCHQDGACDPASGQCVYSNKPDNTTCDDTNYCTQSDTCLSGVCTGTPVQCNSPPGQCYSSSGVCNTNDGSCSYSVSPDYSTCDDGDPCTVNDTCQSGICIGTPKSCAAIDQCHTSGVCNPSTGVCSTPVVANGTNCNDNDLCTVSDKCYAGVCTGIPVVCYGSECYDGGVCNPGNGQCEPVPKANGTQCNDNNLCTRTDACYDGVCVGSNRVTCSALDQCHEVGTCDPTTGYCNDPQKPANTPCNDNNYCTQVDICQNGTCVGSSPVVCTVKDQCHEVGICDTATGNCSNPLSIDGKICNDSSLCTLNDQCQSGVCQGTPKVCTASDTCHDTGICDPLTGVCSDPQKTDGSTCDDYDSCTPTSSCESGYCVGSSTVLCPILGVCQQPGVCNATSGVCTFLNKTDGSSCDDGNACTLFDTCVSGICIGTTPVVCTALDQCHDVGTCSPLTGICSYPEKPYNTSCDDGDACTQTDVCQYGSCYGTNPVVCPFHTSCNDSMICLPNNGTCVPPCQVCTEVACDAPPQCYALPSNCSFDNRCVYVQLPNGTSCDDGNSCTDGDTCSGGVCAGYATTTCPAIDQCHLPGTCNPYTGECTNPIAPDGTPCDDKDSCTLSDTCLFGYCVSSTPVLCNTPGQCQGAGYCNVTTGSCQYAPLTDGTTCDDNDTCTSNDQCVAGHCLGNLISCSPRSQCDDYGYCDSTSGSCLYVTKVNGTACNDGDLCTNNDACYDGTCVPGTPVVCSAIDQCYDAGTCNPVDGTCSTPPKQDGTPCDDSNLCSLNDTCHSGVCRSAQNVTCTALDQCHEAGTCNPADGTCTNPNSVDGKSCNDTNLCSTVDTCQQGLCTGYSYVNCTTTNQCHDDGVCDPLTGICSSPFKNDGTACNDQDLCTQTDQCYQGACTGTNPITCSGDTECAYAGTCDPLTGSCDYADKPDETPCNDGDQCTLNDRCLSGVCTPNNTVVCPNPDQCHNPGVCNTQTGVCSNPVKVDGTSCNDGSLCSANDTCNSGICSGQSISCPIETCGSAGVCQNDTGVCSNPCPPTVTGAIVSQTLRNQFPFEITLATFTSRNETISSGYLASSPFPGAWNLSTNSSLNQYASNGIVTQFWKFLFTPEGTCELDGNYVFNFILTHYPNTYAPLTFYFDSQYFCGQVSNTSISGSVRIYNSAEYANTATIFNENDLLYVWINIESAFTVTLVELMSLSVNNETYPDFGIDNTEQVYYGLRFSMVALIPPFQVNSNTLQFTVRVTLGTGKKRTITARADGPEQMKFSKSVGIRAALPPGTTTGAGSVSGGGSGSVTAGLSSGGNINGGGSDDTGMASTTTYIALGATFGIIVIVAIVALIARKYKSGKVVMGEDGILK